jgi:hypothetical protein
MNTLCEVKTTTAIPLADKHLLDTIQAVKTSVGDGLNDDELTRLLQKTELPDEAGFGFLSYSERFVTLSVPTQNPASWHPEHGRIAAEKEGIARTIAAKHHLTLCQPPDALNAWRESSNSNHHLEFCNGRETAAIFHPLYVKVRIFSATNPGFYARNAQRPYSLGPDFLHDVAAMYKT